MTLAEKVRRVIGRTDSGFRADITRLRGEGFDRVIFHYGLMPARDNLKQWRDRI